MLACATGAGNTRWLLLMLTFVLAGTGTAFSQDASYLKYSAGGTDERTLEARYATLKQLYAVLRDSELRRDLERADADLQRAWDADNAERVGRILSHMEDLLKELDPAEMASAAARARAQSEEGRALRDALAAAQRDKDIAAVREAVEAIEEHLGEYAGVPEVAPTYYPIPHDVEPLTHEEFEHAFTSYLESIRPHMDWAIDEDSTKVRHMLRSPASVITGCVAAYRAGGQPADELLQTAKDCAEYVMWTQDQAEVGLFPFPARRGITEGVFGIAHRALERAEDEGRLDEVMRNGWVIEDAGMDDGGLQFDNGLCGVALLALYEVTQDDTYLESALEAADWAMSRPVVPNWNYNSFSVYLLAETHRVTGKESYLVAAKKKTRLGVLPGQLERGPNRGRWVDPHNARANYHYIIVRCLVSLLATLPEDDAIRPEVINALRSALATGNTDILENGVNSPFASVEALSLLPLRLPRHADVVGDQSQLEALSAMGDFWIHRYRKKEGIRLEPAAWGLFLEAYGALHGLD